MAWPGGAPPSPGSREHHPGRSSCVRNAVTPSRSGQQVLSGKPTVRRAQLLGGNRMAEKRMPAAERRRETTRVGPVLQLIVVDNRPDTGPSWPGSKERRRGQVSPAGEDDDDARTNGQVRRRDRGRGERTRGRPTRCRLDRRASRHRTRGASSSRMPGDGQVRFLGRPGVARRRAYPTEAGALLDRSDASCRPEAAASLRGVRPDSEVDGLTFRAARRLPWPGANVAAAVGRRSARRC